MPTAVFPSMVASYNPDQQVLLVKAVYWAESLSDAVGGTPGTAVYDTMSARSNDLEQVLLVKLVYWLESAAGGSGGGGGGSGTTNGNYAGVAPPTDGSVPTYFAYDTSAGYLWYNSGTIAVPTWNNV